MKYIVAIIQPDRLDDVVILESFELVELCAEPVLEASRIRVLAFEHGLVQRHHLVANATVLRQDHRSAARAGVMRQPRVAPFPVHGIGRNRHLLFCRPPQDLPIRGGNHGT